MFETLFQYPSVLARHREGPAADERRRFLLHRADEGAAPATLLRIARELLVIAKTIDITRSISHQDLETAASKWARRQQRRHRSRGPRWSTESFLQLGTSWLHFLGRLQRPAVPPFPFAHLITEFIQYMRAERGLSEATIRNRCWHVQQFLEWLINQNRSLAEVSIGDVDAFLSGKGTQDWGRVSVATSAQALRAFFRHAGLQGWCANTIAAGISGPRVFKHEALPLGPDWADVRRLPSQKLRCGLLGLEHPS